MEPDQPGAALLGVIEKELFHHVVASYGVHHQRIIEADLIRFRETLFSSKRLALLWVCISRDHSSLAHEKLRPAERSAKTTQRQDLVENGRSGRILVLLIGNQ
jgi:hypothetical protein